MNPNEFVYLILGAIVGFFIGKYADLISEFFDMIKKKRENNERFKKNKR